LIIRPFVQRIILIITILLLLTIAWIALSGGYNQLPRSLTIGQQVQTTVQLACGLLSLLTVVTCVYWKRLRRIIRLAWIISLILAAGLSSIVWGPPMLKVGLIFVIVASLIAFSIIRLLRIADA
jgi:hypothetical protein